jgi:hypothetical protein
MGLILKHVYVYKRIRILITDLEETEAKNDCSGEGQQQFNRPTNEVGGRWSPACEDVIPEEEEETSVYVMVIYDV